MALTLPENFQKLADTNSGSRVALVHLWKDGSTYLALATHALQISTVQYLACVADAGSPSSEWKIYTDNGVTLSAPTVVLNDYQTPDGYSLLELFQTYQFAGKRIQIYYGHDLGSSTANVLTDFVCVFDGTADDPSFDNGQVQIPCLTEELPAVEIAGRILDANAQTIGGTDITGGTIVIPDAAHMNRLPIPFGNHWNAPIICYSLRPDNESRWLSRDSAWWAQLESATRLENVYRNNLNAASYRVLIPQEECLVPFYPTAYTDDVAWAIVSDTQLLQHCIKISSSTVSSGTTMLDGSLWVEVPMRFRYTAFGSATGHDSYDTTSDLVNLFDADGNTDWNITGTLSAGSGSDVFYCDFTALLELERNLRHDSSCIVHPSRPIHIPFGDDEWTVLWFGKYIADPPPAGGYTYELRVTLTPTMTNPAQTCGSSVLIQRSTGTLTYDYFSHLYQTNHTGWHEFDPTTDLVNLGDTNYLADAGNSTASAAEGTLPFLRREALNGGLSFNIELRVGKVGTYSLSQSVGLTVKDLSYHAIETLGMDYGAPLYCDTLGVRVTTSEDNLSTRPSDTTGTYQPYRPPQYVETILRGKCGATTSTLHPVDYSSQADEFWTRNWLTARDYSGFVATGELAFDKWLKEYIADEPFTVYRDSSGLWRFLQQYKTLSDVLTYGTLYTVDFADCDQGFELGFTPLDKVCAEIKSMETDYIYFNQDYAQKWHWKLPSTANPVAYDYTYWKGSNTEASNQFFREKLQKKYTSTPQQADAVSRVSQGGVYYGCTRTNKNQTPSATSPYWARLAGDDSTDWGGTPAAWSASTTYYGEDAENRACAELYLNQWANRHRTVKFGSSKIRFAMYEVGDVICFANVPRSLLGIKLKGWAGEEDETSVAVNGQSVYYTFLVTKVKRGIDGTKIECMQMHDLTAYKATTGGVQSIG